MTDTRAKQLAFAALTSAEGGDARTRQLALVAICSETPEAAGGARAEQIVIVAVSKEFVIPPIYIPFSLGNYMATMPYYIGG